MATFTSELLADSPLARELAELQRTFTNALPQKLDELDRALRQAREGRHDQFAHAARLAHSLRGSSGIYGHAAVGEAAGALDDLLKEARSGDAQRQFFWEDVDGAMHDAREAGAREPARLMADSAPPPAPRQALLVVDGDPHFLEMAAAMKGTLLIDVLTAQSSDQALDQAATHPLMGAIVEIGLRDGVSFHLARQIRDTAGNGEIPIGFTSVDGSLAMRVAALEAGGTKFLEKPTSAQSLRELAEHFVALSQSRQPRVLLVDDDEDVVAHYSRHLRSAGYVVDHLGSADSLLAKLEETPPDVLLLDVNLPNASGIDICRALRTSERWALLPILIISAGLDAETRLRAFRGGASDVVSKPVLPRELLARVGVQEERARLLRERADKDPLSGLMLRRAFSEAFHRALAQCARDTQPLSLVLVDLDHFKQINDAHGHLVGDQVIAGFGDLVRRRFRVNDLRGRWGGEEFILAFPGQGLDFAVRAARRLLVEFGDLRFTDDHRQTFSAGFTAGVAAYPGDGTEMSALIRRADERLYAGKLTGRGTVSAPPSLVSDEKPEVYE